MPAISIVNTQNFLYPVDFDPEHYHPDRRASLALLQKNAPKTVGDCFENIIELVDDSSTTGVFDLTDALGWFLGDGDQSGVALSIKKIAWPNDIIISRLRSYLRELCVVPKRSDDFKPLLSTEFIVLRPCDRKNGTWLLPFLLSKQVQTVLHWSQTGSNHPRFAAHTLLGLPIPKQILNLRDELARIVGDAVAEFERGRLLYPEAEQELLERMQWGRVAEQNTELYFVERFDVTQEHGRMDAEYFHPKYRRLRKHLLKIGAEYVGKFCSLPNRGIQPEFVEGGQVLVIDSKAVRARDVAPSESERTSMQFYLADGNEKGRVFKGDVLLNSTGRGTLGRAACYQSDEFAIADNHVAIIRPTPNVCLPVYLALFLNSPAGLAQSEMFQTGSSGQLELYAQHIVQFLVFTPKNQDSSIDLYWQRKLANKVIEARESAIRARDKLDTAKKMVERAISANI